MGGRERGKRGGGDPGILNGVSIEKQQGERGPGHATAGQWRCPGLSPSREKPPDNKSRTKQLQNLEENSRRARQEHRGAEGTAACEPPQGLTWTWVQAEAGKGGSAPEQEMSRDTDPRRKEQGQAVEASGWRVRVTSRWEALVTGRGGGERVKNERASEMNGYGWGGGRKEEKKTTQKTIEEKCGAEGID